MQNNIEFLNFHLICWFCWISFKFIYFSFFVNVWIFHFFKDIHADRNTKNFSQTMWNFVCCLALAKLWIVYIIFFWIHFTNSAFLRKQESSRKKKRKEREFSEKRYLRKWEKSHWTLKIFEKCVISESQPRLQTECKNAEKRSTEGKVKLLLKINYFLINRNFISPRFYFLFRGSEKFQ